MLTEQQIRDMEPGRELDKVVEENVFGVALSDYTWGFRGNSLYKNYEKGLRWHDIQPYSTDISAAMKVEALFDHDEETRSKYMIQLYILVGLQPHIPPTLEDLYLIAHASALNRCKAALIAHMRGGSGD
jgi:hypothetical protein